MIEKEDIRLKKCDHNEGAKFWYCPEILVEEKRLFRTKEKWIEPYFVNYETLETEYRLSSISPWDDVRLKEFLEQCYKWVNSHDGDDNWKIVDHAEYDRIYKENRKRMLEKNKYVYLK